MGDSWTTLGRRHASSNASHWRNCCMSRTLTHSVCALRSTASLRFRLLRRRKPVDAPKPEHAPVFRVKFHDGPAAGVLKEYPREMQTIQYFTWTYDNLYRREGDYWLFAKRPNNRAVNRILPLVVKQQGRDPRLEPKRQPDR